MSDTGFDVKHYGGWLSSPLGTQRNLMQTLTSPDFVAAVCLYNGTLAVDIQVKVLWTAH
jgi:hypothetical protein